MRIGHIMAAVLLAGFLAVAPAAADVIRLEGEDWKVGGEGVGYHDDASKSGDGSYRPGDNVDAETTGDVGGGYNIGWTNAGEWLILTVDPGTWMTDPTFAGGDYYLYTRAASPNGNKAFHVEIDGNPAASLSGVAANTGGWGNYTTVQSCSPFHLTPLTLGAGQHEVKFIMDDGGINFNWLELSTTVPAYVPNRAITAAVPQGGMGTWGVREVWLNGTGSLGNLEQVRDAINTHTADSGDPLGVRVADYTAPYINIWDSSGRGNLGSDAYYEVVNLGYATRGSVDGVGMVMSGQIEIPADGVYTFDVASDDGFELSIDGNVVGEVNAGKGATDVFLPAKLTAGTHDIRVLYWEGGGGASVEVLAAAGDKTAMDNDFRPIGYVAPAPFIGVPGIKAAPGLTVTQTTPGAYVNPGDPLDTSINDLAEAMTALTVTPTTTVADTVVNYHDQDSGGPGSIPGDSAFPIDVAGTDDNNFALLAEGTIEILQDGTYYFGFQGDDGAALRITGQTWNRIVETADFGGSPGGVIDGDAIVFDHPTGNSRTIGEIDLAAGEYPFEFLFFELAGGAYTELFAGYMEGVYSLLEVDGAMLIPDHDGLELVPEPATLALLGIGGMCVAVFRRRR